jgi:ComF family protein
MRSALITALTLLYPHRCPGCNSADLSQQENFCTSCLRGIRLIHSPLCICCGLPFLTTIGPDHLCYKCQMQPPAFRRARAWAFYQTSNLTPQPLSNAIQDFKYRRRLNVGKILSKISSSWNPFSNQMYDLILPVPLHLRRLRWRGFNQSLLLAQAIGRSQNVLVDPFLLERIRPTVPQTELNEKERRNNVRGAFAVSIPERLQGASVLLIDDVYTSGATVNECARVLCQNGAATVDVFTLARAVPH